MDTRVSGRLTFTDSVSTASMGHFVVDPATGLAHVYVSGADRVVEHQGNKSAASGYASLDSGVHVPTAELGSGSASSTTFLRGDQTWAAPTHGSLGSLAWTSSGHTGTAYSLPYFDGSGNPAVVGPASTFDDYTLQTKTTGPAIVRQGYTHPEHAQAAGIQFNGGTWSIIGQPNISTAGSTSDTTDASKNWTRFVSNTTLGSAAGIRQASTILRLDHAPIFDLYIKTGASVANQRIWIALTATDTSNSDTAPNNSCGLNFSTVAGDTTWWAYARDGSAQTRVDTGVSVTTDTVYKIRLRVSGSSLKVSINDGAEVTASSNFPATSTQLGWVVKIYTNSGGTSVRLDFAYQHHKEA